MDSYPKTEISTDPVTTHISSYESVTTAIVSAIADARECDLADLDPLYQDIDLEAFDSLYTNSSELPQTDLQITFTVADCKVILYGDGRVVAVPGVDCSPDTLNEKSWTWGTEEEE
ncbi:hypothetical protein SAMN05444422_1238 [Halobiforma haloterrestris]|uniref:Halobacterial output domain-containing protein n=1 Tax=Natronobacterium haloterrestre TaxID=148448 RepID=A0A1I1LSZ9_NATHA|nr:HalOD1 output domain-containing protein [Halobiforma haloterrestris]SFC76387.1 hypothetical protein SAMN05444422_1238 [Halobiforma haloterrestris]